jgi:hypothetical protein
VAIPAATSSAAATRLGLALSEQLSLSDMVVP